MALSRVKLFIDVDAGLAGFQMKRGNSRVTWQELNNRERSAVVQRLEDITTVCRGIVDVEPKKYCGQCRRLLPVSAFYKRSDNGKPRPFCKECEMENGRRYRASGKLKIEEKSCSNCANIECREKLKGLNSDFGKTCRNHKRQ